MQNTEHKYLKGLLETFFILSSVFLLGLVLWGLNRGFDITDEGYNFLGMQAGQEKQTIYSALQFVLLSKAFGWVEGLANLRILSIVLTTLAALLFEWGFLAVLRRLYPQRVVFFGLVTTAWMLGNCFFFNVTQSLTFSYNVFINAVMLSTAGLVFYAFSICDQPTRVGRLR